MKKQSCLLILLLFLSAAAFGQSVVSDVWFQSGIAHPSAGQYFELDLFVNAGDDEVLLFMADFHFDAAQLQLDASYYNNGVYCPVSSGGTFFVYGIRTDQISVFASEPSGFSGGTNTYILTMRFQALVPDPEYPDITVNGLRNMDDETILPDNPLFEVGRLNTNQTGPTQWHTVTLQNTYNNPIVIMGTPSNNGPNAMILRVRNVTQTSFQYQLDEWNYLNGIHNAETFGYLVIEKGGYRVNGIALYADDATGVTDVWKRENIDIRAFSGNQIILAQTVTTNESTAVTTRLKKIDDFRFDIRVQEEEGEDGTHSPETIHYLAIDKSSGISGINGKNFISSIEQKITSTWVNIFSPIANPIVFGQILTYEDDDTASLRYNPISSETIAIKITEEQSADSETTHDKETIGYVFFEE